MVHFTANYLSHKPRVFWDSWDYLCVMAASIGIVVKYFIILNVINYFSVVYMLSIEHNQDLMVYYVPLLQEVFEKPTFWK